MGRFTEVDALEVLGILAGAFIVIVALGTFLEPPWTTNSSTGAALVQTVGILLTLAVGLVLIQVTAKDGLRGLLPARLSGADE